MKKDLSHIRRIDIEIQSFCNRSCAWCPNADIDRKFYQILPDEIFTKLLYELKELNFGIYPYSSFSLLGFQEIFFNPFLLRRRVDEIRQYFPNIAITLHTNGDYLNEKSLLDLKVNKLHIMDYDCKGKEYWKNKLKQLHCQSIQYNINTDRLSAIYNQILITVRLNWPHHTPLENRGGFLKKEKLLNLQWKNNMSIRTIPCPEPTYFINIEYDGSVSPCCHIRSDIKEHQQYILGNLKEQSLKDIYYGDKAKIFREVMSSSNYNNYYNACQYCQKTRNEILTGSPNGWEWNKKKYAKPQINRN